MPDSSSKEDRFSGHAITDADFATAYESLGAAKRAGLKRCIAVLYESLGEAPMFERRERRFRHGFTVFDEDIGPASFVLLVCDDSYSSAGRLLAALVPALLAGSLPVVIFRNKSGQVNPALLTALELAGIEDALLLDEAGIFDFFCAKCQGDPAGRLILIGESPFGEALILEAHRAGVLCRSLFSPPVVASVDTVGATGATDPDLLFFWPQLEPGWFRVQNRLAANSNSK